MEEYLLLPRAKAVMPNAIALPDRLDERRSELRTTLGFTAQGGKRGEIGLHCAIHVRHERWLKHGRMNDSICE